MHRTDTPSPISAGARYRWFPAAADIEKPQPWVPSGLPEEGKLDVHKLVAITAVAIICVVGLAGLISSLQHQPPAQQLQSGLILT